MATASATPPPFIPPTSLPLHLIPHALITYLNAWYNLVPGPDTRLTILTLLLINDRVLLLDHGRRLIRPAAYTFIPSPEYIGSIGELLAWRFAEYGVGFDDAVKEGDDAGKALSDNHKRGLGTGMGIGVGLRIQHRRPLLQHCWPDSPPCPHNGKDGTGYSYSHGYHI